MGINILNKTEKSILEIIIKSKEELTAYEVTRRIFPDEDIRVIINRKNFIYKVINDLCKRDILVKKNSYPTYYKINPNIKRDLKPQIKMHEVKCPNCKNISWVGEYQKTKQCHCLTSSGKNLRFWITKQRYTGKMKVI